jgi:hypothetical protein
MKGELAGFWASAASRSLCVDGHGRGPVSPPRIASDRPTREHLLLLLEDQMLNVLLRVFPLTVGLLLTAANTRDCDINIGEGEGEGEGGEGEGEQGEGEGEAPECPVLACAEACDVYATDEAGCPTCTCETCEPNPNDPQPDCEGLRWDYSTCSWQCGTVVVDCSSDVDCGPGARCDFGGNAQRPILSCETDVDCNGEACIDGFCQSPAPTGVCVPVIGCYDDVECGPGFRCELDAAARQAPPDGDVMPPAPGVCIANNCTTDTDCRAGEYCDFSGCPVDDPNCVQPAIRAVLGQCRVRLVSNCSSDVDCAAGETCVFSSAEPAMPCAIDDPNCAARPAAPGTCQPSQCGECPVGTQCEAIISECPVEPVCEIGPDGNEVCFPCDPAVSFECVADPCAICADTQECVVNSCDPALMPPDCDPTADPACGCVASVECRDIVVSTCDNVVCELGSVCIIDERTAAATCALECTSNDQCTTGICALQADGRGVCR